MSDLRRFNAIQAIETIPHAERSLAAIERAARLRPRGSNLPVLRHGIINTQHWEAHTLLQKAAPGSRTPTAWQSKKSNVMFGTYVRQGSWK